MFSLVVVAATALPGQSCGPYYGGYPPVRSTYYGPAICCPQVVFCECEDPIEKRLREVEKKLKTLDDRMAKVEASGKKLDKDLKALRNATQKEFKELEKKNEERLKAMGDKSEERIKGVEQKSEERAKAIEQKSEERVKNLEQRTDDRLKMQDQRTDDRLKVLDQRTDDRLKVQDQRTDDRLKAMDTRWEDRFRSTDDKMRNLDLKLLEERVAQSLKKLEEKLAEAERVKGLETKIDERVKGLETKLDERVKALEDRFRLSFDALTKDLRQIEEKLKSPDGKKSTDLEQKLEALELRVKGKVDVLEERLKGFDGRVLEGKQNLDKLIDQLRQHKKEMDKQGAKQLDDRLKRIEGTLQDLQKMDDRIRKLEGNKVPAMPPGNMAVVHASRTQQPEPRVPEIQVPARRAVIVLQLPADAKLYIEGHLREATGQTTRYIQTPDLDANGTYSYQVRIDVIRQGKLVTETRRVEFRAGLLVRVSFEHLGPAPIPLRTAKAQ